MFSSEFLRKSYFHLNRVISGLFYTGFMFSSGVTYADYSGRILYPSDGYTVALSNSATVETKATASSSGTKYYKVGNPIEINQNNSNTANVKITGHVACQGLTWGDVSKNTSLSGENAFHRLFIYVPSTNETIGGSPLFKINSNLFMKVESYVFNWTYIAGTSACEKWDPARYSTDQFTAQFPIFLTFYINEKVIDGQVVINSGDLGGYVRAFTSTGKVPPQNSWSIGDTTVPLRLGVSTINIPASCTTQTSTGQASTLNLKHDALNSRDYDSYVSGQVNYSCAFSESTSVKLRLDYLKDDDLQKRLPLKNTLIGSTDKIYSELTMHDESTGQAGTEITTNIEKSKTITITSHIQGSNAATGNYQGSAWLIATFN
ncbi:hypothetical protein [Acinetobacter guerrae]|uniref:hypothetical protein n=2 Tax=Acinetobacter guerrae TaxID=1843371 RepID=UPI0019D57586|nr:hypothetical protein [Acinetobacter guerrae]